MSAFIQLLDFILKALTAYLDTEEGQKELMEIAEAMGIDNA